MRNPRRSRPSVLAIAAIVVPALAACGGPTPMGSPAPASQAPVTFPSRSPAPSSTVGPSQAPTTSSSPAPTTPDGSPIPSQTQPPIAITEVECLGAQTVRLHISITAEAGIPTYAVWSTWGGGGDTARSFPTPYTNHIDEEIEFTHAIKDPEPGRIHQFGLAVTVVGIADPIIVYAVEPENRCPGH